MGWPQETVPFLGRQVITNFLHPRSLLLLVPMINETPHPLHYLTLGAAVQGVLNSSSRSVQVRGAGHLLGFLHSDQSYLQLQLHLLSGISNKASPSTSQGSSWCSPPLGRGPPYSPIPQGGTHPEFWFLPCKLMLTRCLRMYVCMCVISVCMYTCAGMHVEARG